MLNHVCFYVLGSLGQTGRWGHKIHEPGMPPRSFDDISARDLEARMKKQLAMGETIVPLMLLMHRTIIYAQLYLFLLLVPLGHTGRWGHKIAEPGMGPRSFDDIFARDLEARMKKQLAMGELTLPLLLLTRFWILYSQRFP